MTDIDRTYARHVRQEVRRLRKQLAESRRMQMLLAERLAICSALLTRCAERRAYNSPV